MDLFGDNTEPSVDLSPPKPASERVSNPPPACLDQILICLSNSTFTVFQLPDELILSILSHISPDPHLTGDYARFCVQYCMKLSDGHQQRMKFLRPLSKTCRAMRLRFLPWIWDHIQPSQASYDRNGIRMISWYFVAITRTVYADMSLATRVKYFHGPPHPCVGADSRFLEVHDTAFPGGSSHSPICPVPGAPPKYPHA